VKGKRKDLWDLKSRGGTSEEREYKRGN